MQKQIEAFQSESRERFRTILESEHRSLLDPDNFALILQTALVYCGIERLRIEMGAETTNSTLGRWILGQNTPSYMKRMQVINWIRDELSNTDL